MFIVSREQCQKLGTLLAPIPMRANAFSALGPQLSDMKTRALVFLYVSAVCHQTESLRGTIEGRSQRGWDYLMSAFMREAAANPAALQPSSIRKLTTGRLQTIVSDDGVANTSTLSEPAERAAYLRNVASVLDTHYAGNALTLYGDGTLSGENGLYSKLQTMDAFASDPIAKKATVYFMLMNKSGIWPTYQDPQQLKPMPDYHKERLFLRTGCITVTDSNINQQLQNRVPQPIDVDNALRDATAQAYKEVLPHSGKDFFELEVLLWSFARSYCYHAPICVQGSVPTSNFEEYAKTQPLEQCVFANVCPKLIQYWQPIVNTDFH